MDIGGYSIFINLHANYKRSNFLKCRQFNLIFDLSTIAIVVATFSLQ